MNKNLVPKTSVWEKVWFKEIESNVPFHLLVEKHNKLDAIAQKTKKTSFWFNENKIFKAKHGYAKLFIDSSTPKIFYNESNVLGPWEATSFFGCDVSSLPNNVFQSSSLVYWNQGFLLKNWDNEHSKHIQLRCKKHGTKFLGYSFCYDDVISIHFGHLPPAWPLVQTVNPFLEKNIFVQRRKNSYVYVYTDEKYQKIVDSKLNEIEFKWDINLDQNEKIGIYEIKANKMSDSFIKVVREKSSFFDTKQDECLIKFAPIHKFEGKTYINAFDPTEDGESAVLTDDIDFLNVYVKNKLPIVIDESLPMEIVSTSTYKNYYKIEMKISLPVSRININCKKNQWMFDCQ